MQNKEIENTDLLSFKNKTKEAIKKSKEIIHHDKNNQCECSKEVSLAYDMQYVERYIEQLENKVKELEKEKQAMINRLESDIPKITKILQDGKHFDDYSRCRLKAYRTKTKEILEILKGETK